MHISGKRLFAFVVLVSFLVCIVASAGCITMNKFSPLPNEVKIRGSVISVDSKYIAPETIVGMLCAPNEYEKEVFDAVDAYLVPENPVIEVGVGTGAVAAYVNKKLKTPQDHVVIEANPYLMPLLEKTKERNELGFKLSGKAVAYSGDDVHIQVSTNLLANGVVSKSNDQTVVVPATTISKILDEYNFQQEDNVTIITESSGVAADIFANEKNLSASVGMLISNEWNINAETSADLLRLAKKAGYVCQEISDLGVNALRTFVFVRGTYTEE